MTLVLTETARLNAIRVKSMIEAELTKRRERAAHMRRVAEDADAVRKECERFTGFVKNAWHIPEPGIKYLPNWHIDAIGEHLEAIKKRQITRFLCNMPPGMMKSTTISVMFPAWEWTTEAWLRYFSTSYEASYARRDSRKHRDLVQSEWYQTLWPDITLTKFAEDDFENTMKGGRKAVPFKRLTAGRGNRLMIDDPHSTEGAESELERAKATRMFRESASSRLNDQERDAIIVVMQRLNPDDLCGVIEQAALPYVKLILPMEYVRSLSVKTPWFTDPRTEEGELLHPAFMGRANVEEKKIEVMEHGWATQYQQQPRARDGAYFFSRSQIMVEKKTANGESTYEPAPKPERLDAVFAVIDSATKTGKKNDGTGVTYFGFNMHPKPHGFILDWDLKQIEAQFLEIDFPNVLKRGEELARECHSRSGFAAVYIEDKDSGQILLQKGRTKWPGKMKPLTGDLVAMGKEGRAVSVSGYINRKLLKITQAAFDKTLVYKGRLKNHLLDQVTTFRVGHGTPHDEDELFDTFCYGAAVMFGDKDGK